MKQYRLGILSVFRSGPVRDYHDMGTEYEPNAQIVHMIVAIREADGNSDLALITRRGNYSVDDPHAVLKCGCVAKVI